jgi:hypothetical protein
MLRFLVAILLIGSIRSDPIHPSHHNLTGEQVDLIQSTWSPLTTNPSDTGMELFHHYFKKYPASQQLFPKFKDVPLENLKQLPAFKEHSTKIFNVFNHVIRSAGVEGKCDKLEELSDFHAARGLIDRQRYVEFRGILLELLGVAGDERATWNLFLDNFFNQFFSKF